MALFPPSLSAPTSPLSPTVRLPPLLSRSSPSFRLFHRRFRLVMVSLSLSLRLCLRILQRMKLHRRLLYSLRSCPRLRFNYTVISYIKKSFRFIKNGEERCEAPSPRSFPRFHSPMCIAMSMRQRSLHLYYAFDVRNKGSLSLFKTLYLLLS